MNWEDLDIFCHVIDHGSFSGAARVLRRPKSSVSASVARLEARLGTRVIERTTRRLRLTEAGESLYREMSPLFGHLREALGNAAAKGQSVSGRLRIAAPYEFGAHHLGAVACAMLSDHPELEVDIDVEGPYFASLVEAAAWGEASDAEIELLEAHKGAWQRELIERLTS